MDEKEAKVYEHLDKLGIPYERKEHPPVYTVEEAEEHWQDIKGAHCKNLFLRNDKGNQHYLVVAEQNKKIDLKKLSERVGAGRLSFASANRLEQYLGLEQGAVSPFGLINDTGNDVKVLLDIGLKKSEFINFHPNVNTATVTITFKDFDKFLSEGGYKVKFI
jgi:Ala-tRNA(Pro) deacylase